LFAPQKKPAKSFWSDIKARYLELAEAAASQRDMFERS
jgi:hypothetical protein